MLWWNNSPVIVQKMLLTYAQMRISAAVTQVYPGVSGKLEWPSDERMQAELCRARLELEEYFK